MSVLNRNFAVENIIKTMITIIRRIIMTMVAVLAAVGCSDESSELNARTMENTSNRSQTTTLLTQWLATLEFQNKQDMKKMYVTINGQTQGVTLADNQAAQQLVSKLEEGQLDVTLSSSGGFEIWGPLGFSLPTSNRQITAQPGDVVIYNGSNICLFYGSNSWSYTPLGKIDGLTVNELQAFLQAGKSNIKVTLSLTPVATSIGHVNSNATKSEYYTLQGQRVEHPSQGIYISDNKKVMIK